MSGPHPPATAAGSTMTLGELARVLPGDLEGDPAGTAASFAVDSRAVEPGTVFFALTGTRTDGHLFLEEVGRRRPAAAVVRRETRPAAGLTLLRVDDPAEALIRLGRHFRDAWPLQVVGITGSAGKTTTKDFAAALLAARFRVFKSEGNLNSTIGLPLTLTGRRPEQDLAVLELGMSSPGELGRLARLARPDVAVITNVGLAHVQNFTSADDIARAKAEILEGVPADGTFVANADDARVLALAERFPGRTVTFGLAAAADVRGLDPEPLGAAGTRFTVACGKTRASVVLPAVGLHHVHNVLAALAAAHALGLDPIELLPAVAALGPDRHRGELLHLAGDVLVIDDCYNSNPAALASALAALGSLPAPRRVAVLGDMRELGTFAEVSHREAGRQAALHADVVIGVGGESEVLVEEAHATGCRDVQHVPDAETAAAVVASIVRDGDALLVKASRGVGLEAVVEALVAARERR